MAMAASVLVTLLAQALLPPGASICTGASSTGRASNGRRQVVTAFSSALLLRACPALAEDADVSEELAKLRRITDTVSVTLTVGTGEPQKLVFGLYGEAAPKSVALFSGLCTGSLEGAPGISYVGSTASRVERGKQIVLGRLSAGDGQFIERTIDATGYVRSALVNKADGYTNSDANPLSHDRAGLLSMQRGGGAFEFTLTPAANPELDGSQLVVGEVLEGLDVLASLNDVPARKPAKDNEVGSLVYSLGAYDEDRYLGVAKAGGDPRARIDLAYKPLQKIKIVGCEKRPRR